MFAEVSFIHVFALPMPAVKINMSTHLQGDNVEDIKYGDALHEDDATTDELIVIVI